MTKYKYTRTEILQRYRNIMVEKGVDYIFDDLLAKKPKEKCPCGENMCDVEHEEGTKHCKSVCSEHHHQPSSVEECKKCGWLLVEHSKTGLYYCVNPGCKTIPSKPRIDLLKFPRQSNIDYHLRGLFEGDPLGDAPIPPEFRQIEDKINEIIDLLNSKK